MKHDPALLTRHWVHSHEEDTADRVVFRPAGYAFPPSRGRRGFELKPGGKYVEHRIGPTDRTVKADGTWKMQDDGNLSVTTDAGAPAKTLNVVEVDQERLVMRRE
jgi:hypothetical protein